MKKLAATFIVLAVLAAGGWFGLQAFADRRLQTAIAHARAGLAAGDSFTYASAKALPWSLGADFIDIEIHRHGTILRARSARLSHVGQDRLGGATLHEVTFQANGIEGSIAGVDASDLSAEPGANPPRLDQIRVGSLRWHSAEVHVPAIPGLSVRVAELQFSQHPGQPGTLLQHGAADQVQILTQAGMAMSIAHLTDESHALVQGDRPVDAVVTSTMTGLQIPPESTLGRQLAQIGYPSAQGDGSSHVHYTVAQGGTPDGIDEATAEIDPTVLRLAGIGQVSIAMKLDRIPVQGVKPPPAKVGQARLLGTALTYDDAGLTGRLLQRFADRSGITPAQLRDRLRHVLQARGDADGNTGFEPEIIHFLDDPRQLVIALDPPTPITLSDLGTIQLRGAAAVPRLGLTVKAD